MDTLVADQLPAQFTPVLVAIIVDTDPENPVITAGRTMTGRIEAVGPDDSVLFVAQLRQPVSPPSIPLIRARAQIIAQVPFMAAKPGDFKISARMAVVDANENVMGEVIATREIKIADAASLRPAAN